MREGERFPAEGGAHESWREHPRSTLPQALFEGGLWLLPAQTAKEVLGSTA